jgi:hypothetical protein
MPDSSISRYEFFKVLWSYDALRAESFKQSTISTVNRPLSVDLLSVAGRYLSCRHPRFTENLEFAFAVRTDKRGFLNLDVNQHIILGGCCLNHYAFSDFAAIADKYHMFSTMGVSSVPAVVFGCFEECCFYIESPFGFPRVEAFFIDASHRFIAKLIHATCQKTGRPLEEILVELSKGIDQFGILAREPLMYSIVKSLADSAHRPFFEQLCNELRRII